jgi:hypothetical protein
VPQAEDVGVVSAELALLSLLEAEHREEGGGPSGAFVSEVGLTASVDWEGAIRVEWRLARAAGTADTAELQSRQGRRLARVADTAEPRYRLTRAAGTADTAELQYRQTRRLARAAGTADTAELQYRQARAAGTADTAEPQYRQATSYRLTLRIGEGKRSTIVSTQYSY